MNKKILQSIPSVFLFDRFRKNSKNKENEDSMKKDETPEKREVKDRPKINVRDFFYDMSLIREEDDYVLNGRFMPDKPYSRLALHIIIFHETGGVKYGTPLKIFYFDDNCDWEVAKNLFLRFKNIFDEIKYISFSVVNNPDENMDANNFHTYDVIGTCDIQFDEIIQDSCKNHDDNIKGYKYLDDLIHSGSKEVILDSDIIIDDLYKYDIGVTIDVDDIVIDGNGHTLDARSMIPHFAVLGNNVTIKNFIFKKGVSKVVAGSIFAKTSGVLNIINCTFDNCTGKDGGGAIFNENASINIENCQFIGNASLKGGAIYNSKNLKVSNSIFDGNGSEEIGGAILNDSNGTAMVMGCEFVGNTSNQIAGTIGNFGKIRVNNTNFKNNKSNGQSAVFACFTKSTTEINEAVFEGNSAVADGGAILIDHSNINILNSNFINNSSNHSAGAISNIGGELSLENVNFEANHADIGGAVALSNNGVLKMSKVKMIGNSANSEAGALYVGGKAFLKTVLFDGNKSRLGGALFNNDETKLSGTFFKNNVSEDKGSAVFNENFALIQILDSKFENNKSGVGNSIFCENPDSLIISNCDISDQRDVNMDLRDRSKRNKQTTQETTQSETEVNYARVFKEVYERTFIFNKSGDISEAQINEILALMDVWGQKYPDDLNYKLAFIYFSSGTWSADRIQIQVDSVKKQYTPRDNEMTFWFDRLIDQQIEMKR